MNLINKICWNKMCKKHFNSIYIYQKFCTIKCFSDYRKQLIKRIEKQCLKG